MNTQCKTYLSSPSSSPFIWPYNFYIIGENSFTLTVLKRGISVLQGALEMHVLCKKTHACPDASS